MRSLLVLILAPLLLTAQPRCASVPGWSAWFSFDGPEFARLATKGLVGKALHLDGKSQYWEFPAGTPGIDVGTKDFTIDVWIRTRESGTRNFVDKRSAVPFGYALFVHQGFAGFQIAHGNHGNIWSRDLRVNDGRWHHMAAVAKRLPPTNPELYVDGVMRASSSRSTPLDNLDVPDLLWLGKHHQNARVARDDYFAGDLDELTFYPRTLSAREIEAIHRAGSKGKCRSR